MKVTVAICTWNRSKLLDQTFTEMRKLIIPEGVTWELLVVNNNCTDDTNLILNRHADHLPLQRLFEPKQGQSNARNCAVAAATGDLLLWTDDDVLVDSGWLAANVDAACRWPDAVFFGGAIEPWFGQQPPASILTNFRKIANAYAVRDFGPEVRPLAADEHPFGANLAVRMAVQKRFRFDARLGRVGSGLVGDDESKLLDEFRAAGYQGIWVGTSRVKHYIPPQRASWAYIWKYYHGTGQSSTRRNGVLDCPTVFGHPRWILKQHYYRLWQAYMNWLVGRPSWVEHYTRAAFLQGCLAECRAYMASHSRLRSGTDRFLVPPLDAAPVILASQLGVTGQELDAASSGGGPK